MPECVFCEKISEGSVETLKSIDLAGPFRNKVFFFEPLGPVTPGHTLFVHKTHTPDAAYWPQITSEVFYVASQYAKKMEQPFNLIVNAGELAGQSVFHLHVHYLPRVENDGLVFPWTNQKGLK